MIFVFRAETITHLTTELKSRGSRVDAAALARDFGASAANFLVMQEFERELYRLPAGAVRLHNSGQMADLLREIQEEGGRSTKAIRQQLKSLATQAEKLRAMLEGLSAKGQIAIASVAGQRWDDIVTPLGERLHDLSQHAARATLPGVGRSQGARIARRFMIRQLAGHFEARGGQPTTTRGGDFSNVVEILLPPVLEVAEPGNKRRTFHEDIVEALKV